MHHKTWKALLVLILTVGVASFWWFEGKPTQAPPGLDQATADHEGMAPGQPGGDMDADTKALAEDQLAANQAAQQQVGLPPITGPVTVRPEFVSLIEWNVLKQVAGQHEQPEQEFTRLINHLRFAKQWELWKANAASDAAERRALAEQLLDEIPVRVANQELDRVYAQQMQMSLLNDLVSDPSERRQRAAQEAERIGVSFSVEKS